MQHEEKITRCLCSLRRCARLSPHDWLRGTACSTKILHYTRVAEPHPPNLFLRDRVRTCWLSVCATPPSCVHLVSSTHPLLTLLSARPLAGATPPPSERDGSDCRAQRNSRKENIESALTHNGRLIRLSLSGGGVAGKKRKIA